MAKIQAVAAVLFSLCFLAPSNGFIGGKASSRTLRPSLTKRFSNPTKGEVDIVQQQLDFALASETSSLVPVPLKEPARAPKPIDKPQLITFDATGTIMRLAEPVGMHYREVLLKHTGLRLPRPSIFTMAFTEVYAARCDAMPCFGCGESVSSADWWAPVVRDTYLKIGVPADIIDPVLPVVFKELYDTVFTGTTGWELADDAEFVLETLKTWQEESGDGFPKLGVISNFDERLPKLLEALGISHYFDFVITSKESGMEKPSRQIFDIALTRLGITERSKAVHVGDSFDKDVIGASSAGWNAVLIKPPPFSEEAPTDTSKEYQRVGDLVRVLDLFGLSDETRPIVTTPTRGVFE